MLNLQPVSTQFFLMAALVVTSAGIILLLRYQTPMTHPGGVLMLRTDFDMLSYFLYTFGGGFLSVILLFQILLHQLLFSRIDCFLLIRSFGIVFWGLLETVGKNPFVSIASLQIGYALSSILALFFIIQVRASGRAPVICGFVLEYPQDGIPVLDSYDNAIEINRSAEQIIGRSDMAVVEMPVLRVWVAREKLPKNQTVVEIFVCEFQLSVSRAEFPFDINCLPVLNGNQARIILTNLLEGKWEFYSDRRIAFWISFERITNGKVKYIDC